MAADLGVVVDTVVSVDLRALSVAELQEQYAVVAPQVQRLTGFAGAVLAELNARGGGTVPTADGRTRPLPGWAAEASGDSASAAGRLQQTASALKTGLPKVAQAVLDGTVPFVRAQVLTRLVGKISPEALAEAEDGLLVTARLMDPQALADDVRHLVATWVERRWSTTPRPLLLRPATSRPGRRTTAASGAASCCRPATSNPS